MDIFDKIGETAKETYKYTADKATKLTKEAKLRMQIREYKDKINNLYESIGERVYENHVREEKEDITDFVSEKCGEIDVFAKEIEDARTEVLKLRNKKQCPSCYAKIESGYKYCPECGGEQEETIDDIQVEEEVDDEVIDAEIVDETDIDEEE